MLMVSIFIYRTKGKDHTCSYVNGIHRTCNTLLYTHEVMVSIFIERSMPVLGLWCSYGNYIHRTGLAKYILCIGLILYYSLIYSLSHGCISSKTEID